MIRNFSGSGVTWQSHVFENLACGFGFGSRQLPFIAVDRLSATQHQIDVRRFRSDIHNRMARKSVLLSESSPAHELEAAHLFKLGAAAGNSDCQFSLGVLTAIGRGTPKDLILSAALLRASARSGHPAAANLYGLCLKSGSGVNPSPEKAARMFRVAAEAGYNEGMFSYGKALLKGFGVPQNPTIAYSWFEKAAETGHAKSMFFAAFLLKNGMGVQENQERAIQFIAQAKAESASPEVEGNQIRPIDQLEHVA
jgi:TPR repeat protein